MGESQLGETMRQVLLYSDEDGHWVSECHSLPGCISQGQTKEEAITNIKEAINLYISVLEEDGLSVPEERFDALAVNGVDNARQSAQQKGDRLTSKLDATS